MDCFFSFLFRKSVSDSLVNKTNKALALPPTYNGKNALLVFLTVARQGGINYWHVMEAPKQ